MDPNGAIYRLDDEEVKRALGRDGHENEDAGRLTDHLEAQAAEVRRELSRLEAELERPRR